jgi:type IV secretory pathway VirB10-like protein
VAAILIVALTVYIYIESNSNNQIPENQMASVEKEPEKKDNVPEVKELPVKNDKTEQPKNIQAEPVKPAVKKNEPKQNQTKIIRENSQGRLINDDLASLSIDDETLLPLKTKTASFSVPLASSELVPVTFALPVYSEPVLKNVYWLML